MISKFLAKTSREIAIKTNHRESFIKVQHIENSVYIKNVVENKFRKITYRESLIKLQHIENCSGPDQGIVKSVMRLTCKIHK